MFWQLVANGLVTGSVIAISAVGVSLVYGILRLVNFAYGDFMAFGALAAYAFNGPRGLHEPLPRVDRPRARAAPGAPARVRAAAPDVQGEPVQGVRDRERPPLAAAADHNRR